MIGGEQTTTYQRINITLPEETVRLLNRMVRRGNRSRFIAEAVKRHARGFTKANLRKKIKEEAITWAGYDLKMAQEWFPIDEQTWFEEKE